MNIKNISEGMIVKNYKQMCELLGETIKSGNGKIAQIKEWECYFSYYKDGNKYVITEVFDDKKININNKTNSTILKNISKGSYSKEMFPMVKSFVGKSEVEFHSKSKLMRELKLKNENYDIAYKSPSNVAKYLSKELQLEVTKEDIHTILSAMWSISQDKIGNAFVNLNKLGLISDYTDKLLCIINTDTHKCETVYNSDYQKITNCIYQGKLNALAKFYTRCSSKCMEDYIDLINVIKEECSGHEGFDFIEKMNSKLNIELFLRGLSEEARKEGLDIMKKKGLEYIGGFYYAYGYIKNNEIEWDKEILDIAKETIHINDFKNAVKEEYILSIFLDKWFIEEEKKVSYLSTDSKKRKFMTELKKNRKEYSYKLDILFDILVNEDTNIKLNNMKSQEKECNNSEDCIPF